MKKVRDLIQEDKSIKIVYTKDNLSWIFSYIEGLSVNSNNGTYNISVDENGEVVLNISNAFESYYNNKLGNYSF